MTQNIQHNIEGTEQREQKGTAWLKDLVENHSNQYTMSILGEITDK